MTPISRPLALWAPLFLLPLGCGGIPTAAPTTPTPTFPVEPSPTPSSPAGPTPTATAAATPTAQPVATPTDAPVATPTDAPVATPTDAPVATPTDAPVATPTHALDVDLSPMSVDFFSLNLQDATTRSCTLADGTTSTCWELTFGANPVNDGPYCPATIDDIGGFGVYDGDTHPGFQVMKDDLWNAMEADGYDIVEPDGDIRIADPTEPIDRDFSYCLEATPDDDLLLTFLIPETPKRLGSPDAISNVELFGVSLDGVPMNGPPPSVVSGMGAGNIPALDPCGGHPDPSGYYHWHLVAAATNALLDALGITDVTCTEVDQGDGKLSGFARDGYPIYTDRDAGGAIPDDLDTCNGHIGVTPEFPGGVYHYHAVSGEAPNIPPCVVGVAASQNFRYQ